MSRAALSALVFAAAVSGLGAASGSPELIPLTMPSGKVLQVELMVKEEDRQMGVMFRPSLPQDHGLLFVFEEADFHGFWMKNCRFPIDMVWLDSDHKVVHVEESVPPCRKDPCPIYSPMRKASYVLEVNAGQARREKAVVGTSLDFKR